MCWTDLVLGQVARGALDVALAHEEQQVVAVDGLLLLEQEVPHEQVRPVRRPLQHHKTTLWKLSVCIKKVVVCCLQLLTHLVYSLASCYYVNIVPSLV